MPELDDRARPSYPTQVFDDLTALSELSANARIVEIGCGTGQATLPLAERGFAIMCVELGEQLASFARRKLARFPSVDVINSDFEDWQPQHAEFDAIVAFTAFHWIDSEVRYVKAAELLHERGKLGIVSAQHVLPPDGDPFFVEVQEDYDAVVPDDPKTKTGSDRPPHPDTVADLTEEIATSGRFRNLGTRRYLWDVTYTADDYIAVLNTYSGHRAFDEKTRERCSRASASGSRPGPTGRCGRRIWQCSTSPSASSCTATGRASLIAPSSVAPSQGPFQNTGPDERPFAWPLRVD